MNTSDTFVIEGTWILEHLIKNPVVEKYIMDNFTPAEEKKVRGFIDFLSDTYPAIRPIIWPDRTIEEVKEKPVTISLSPI